VQDDPAVVEAYFGAAGKTLGVGAEGGELARGAAE
jgi:hypothetical protein